MPLASNRLKIHNFVGYTHKNTLMKGLNIAHSADLKFVQARLRSKIEQFNRLGAETDSEVANLFRNRKDSVKQIAFVADYVSKLKNCPESAIQGANRAQTYATALREEWAKHENVNADFERSGSAGTAAGLGGAAIGGATALLGPSAAMAIATTFGTASTGTAISALAGGAATNAALAWLGGGAVAAGGAGMAGGASVLALFGPVGWAIAGTSLIGGVFFSSIRNKKAISEIKEKINQIDELINTLGYTLGELKELSMKTFELARSLDTSLQIVKKAPRDYNDTDYPKEKLFSMIDSAKLLGKISNEKIS